MTSKYSTATNPQDKSQNKKAVSNIQTIFSFKEALPILKKATPETLVLFDVDLILQHPANKNFQGRTLLQYQDILKQNMYGFTSEEKDRFLLSLVFGKPLELVEKQSPQLIQDLQHKNIKTLIFTGFATGTILDTWIPQWRYESLRSAGINCNACLNLEEKIWFRQFPQYLNIHPLYYKGILFSNGHYGPLSKAQVLFTFLDKINWSPQEIIFFDDRLENIQGVQESEAIQQRQIPYYGFYYKGGYQYPLEIPVKENILQDWANAQTYFRGFQIDYPPS